MKSCRPIEVYVTCCIAACALLGPGCTSEGGSVPGTNSNEVAYAASSLAVAIGNRALAYDLSHREGISHGAAGDRRLIFYTEPLARRVVVLDRSTGEQIGILAEPSESLAFPFSVRVLGEGRLVVLDGGAFPPPGTPKLYTYDYRWDPMTRKFTSDVTRVASFEGLTVTFGQDVEILHGGLFAVSDPYQGAIWIVHPNGTISKGLFPETNPISELALCPTEPITLADGTLFDPVIALGVGPLAERDGYLYWAPGCVGGVWRIAVDALIDPLRSPEDRAADIEPVTRHSIGASDTFGGLAFDRWHVGSPWLYATDPINFRLVRINVDSGVSEILLDTNQALFDFPTGIQMLPPVFGLHELIVTNSEEQRLAIVNRAITEDALVSPVLLDKVFVW